MAYITFEQFQATCVAMTAAELAEAFDEGSGNAGYAYGGGHCYIEVLNGEFLLTIYNEQWSSENLADLEAKLFVHFFIYEGQPSGLMLKQGDGSLDDFVLTYCKARGIECDGDVMGLAFSQVDEAAGISPQDARGIMEQVVKDADLWSNVEPSAVRTVDNPDIATVRAALAASEATILHVSPPCEAFAKGAPAELPIKQYMREFPDFDYVIPSIYGLKDASWHNDACPCFESEQFSLQVWFDYADHAKREFPDDDLPQFSLRRLALDSSEEIASSNDFASILSLFYQAVVFDMTALDRREWLGKAYKETVGYNPFEEGSDETAGEVLLTLAGVIAEDFHASNEAPEWPDTTEMIDAITAAEGALTRAQTVVAGNDLTEGDEAEQDTPYFPALVLCRKVLADVERVKAHEAAKP